MKKIEALINKVLEARKQQEKTGFDIKTFTIYRLLKQENVTWFDSLVPIVNNAFLRFPYFTETVYKERLGHES